MKKIILPLIILPILSYGAALELIPSPDENTSNTMVSTTSIIPVPIAQSVIPEHPSEEFFRNLSLPENRHKFLCGRINTIVTVKDFYLDALEKIHPRIYWTLKIIEGYIDFFENIVNGVNKYFPLTEDGKFKNSSPDELEPFDRVVEASSYYNKYDCFKSLFKKEGITIEEYIIRIKKTKENLETFTISNIMSLEKRILLRNACKPLFCEIEKLKKEIDENIRLFIFKASPVIDPRKIQRTVYAYSNALSFIGRFWVNSVYYGYTEEGGFSWHFLRSLETFMTFVKNSH